ncbi:phage integrase SAM-like domain-containing protein [Lacipirellula sp.]|uniref:phage integrase SAM-like domain-containing protein n=1 Tax=Lacipirellula sp. TaxID=2691419 RepID=UPI003D11C6CC
MRNNPTPVRRAQARELVKVDHEAMARWSLLKVISDAMKPLGEYSQSTIQNYREAARKFQRHIGYEQSPVNVTEAKLAAFEEWLEAEGYAAKTVRLNVDNLAAVVRYADPSLLPSRSAPERPALADSEVRGTIEWFFVNEYFPVAEKITSEETKRQYAMAAARFSKHLGRPARLADLTDERLEAWVVAMQGESLQRKTINTYMNYLRAFWNWAFSRGMIVQAPRIRNVSAKGGERLKEPAKPTEVRKSNSPYRRNFVRRGSPAEKKSYHDLCGPNGAIWFVNRYLASREVCPLYAQLLRLHMTQLARFEGKADIESLFQEDAVNEYTASLNGQDGGKKLSAYTIKARLSNIISLWNAAADEDLVPYPRLRRLRRPKCPALVIECYTTEEVQRLLAAAAQLKRQYSNGVRACDYWTAAIRVAWDSGLRRGDVIRLRKSAIREDGALRVVQNKTRQIVSVRFRESTMAALAAIQYDDALAWTMDLTYFGRHFKKLVRASRIGKGSFKWVRRSSGTYVEMIQPGAGTKHLGHRTPQVFDRHYDGKLGPHLLPQPPELV